jgi:hypothetical protein
MHASTKVWINAFRAIVVIALIAVGCAARHAALAATEHDDLQRHATASQIVSFVQATKISAR